LTWIQVSRQAKALVQEYIIAKNAAWQVGIRSRLGVRVKRSVVALEDEVGESDDAGQIRGDQPEDPKTVTALNSSTGQMIPTRCEQLLNEGPPCSSPVPAAKP
jgi:hypothetical protein